MEQEAERQELLTSRCMDAIQECREGGVANKLVHGFQLRHSAGM